LGNVEQASGLSEETIAINLRVLQELGRLVHESGGRFVIVDAVRYHAPGSGALSARIEQFCGEHGVGYANASEAMLRKEAEGITTARAYDGHLNEAGNEALGLAMHRWMTSAAGRPGGGNESVR